MTSRSKLFRRAGTAFAFSALLLLNSSVAMNQQQVASMPPIVQLLLDADTQSPTNPDPETPTSGDTISVSNIDQLNAQIASVSGNTLIVLEPGSYGRFISSKKFSDKVTLRSRVKHQARFSTVDISDSSHFELEGWMIDGELTGENTKNVVIKDSKMGSAVFKFAEQAVYQRNDSRYVNFNNASFFTLEGNYIHHASADLLHIKGNAHHFSVVNNTLFDTIPDAAAHSDAIQMAGNRNGTPHDFVLRGNYVFDDPSTVQAGAENANKKLQGFFLADARDDDGYYNVLIENNLLQVSNTSNSIAVLGASRNITVRNNTLLPTSVGSGGGIRISEHSNGSYANFIVRDNVASTYKLGGAPSTQLSGNVFYNKGSTQQALTELFTNHADYGDWRAFIPKPGSSIDFGSGVGAEQRVKELLAK